MFPGRVTLFTDVPSLFADVLTKPADLAIGDHRAPQSGQCKPGFTETLFDTDGEWPRPLRPNPKILSQRGRNPGVNGVLEVGKIWNMINI